MCVNFFFEGGCSVTQSCLTCYGPVDCSKPGFPILHYLLEFAQIHVHRVNDAVQPSTSKRKANLNWFGLYHRTLRSRFRWADCYGSNNTTQDPPSSVSLYFSRSGVCPRLHLPLLGFPFAVTAAALAEFSPSDHIMLGLLFFSWTIWCSYLFHNDT